MKNKGFSLVLALFLLFGFFANSILVHAKSTDNKISTVENCIPKEAIQYANSRIGLLVSSHTQPTKSLDSNTKEMGLFTLGEPYFIYSVKEDGKQEPIYYFPVVVDKEIVFTVFVCYINDSWSAGIGTEYVPELNAIAYANNPNVIFYQDGNTLYAEGDKLSKSWEIQTFDSLERPEKASEFTKLSLPDKIKHIKESYQPEQRKVTTTNELDGTGFSISTSSERRLDMSGRMVGQGSDKICWAASVATTYRYRTNTSSLTARNVCDKIGHSYTEGTMNDRKKALTAYGISYSITNGAQPTFAQIQTNIQNQWPLLISSGSGSQGHAVTAIGYSTTGGINLVTFHNSGPNALQTVEYKSTGTVFGYNNMTWTWRDVLRHQ